MSKTRGAELIFLAALLIVAFLQCTNKSDQSRSRFRTAHPFDKADTSASILGCNLILKGEAFRVVGIGALPIRRDNGLIAMLTLLSLNSAILPSSIRADSMWIADRDSLWITVLTSINQKSSPSGNALSLTISDGPKWPENDTIDIVVRILAGDTVCYLATPKLTIASRGGGH